MSINGFQPLRDEHAYFSSLKAAEKYAIRLLNLGWEYKIEPIELNKEPVKVDSRADLPF